MFRRNLLPIWIGILMMASFFLVGQDWGASTTGGLHLIDAVGTDVGLVIEHSIVPQGTTTGPRTKVYNEQFGWFFEIDLYAYEGDEGIPKPEKRWVTIYWENGDCTGRMYADQAWSSSMHPFYNIYYDKYLIPTGVEKDIPTLSYGVPGDCYPDVRTLLIPSSLELYTGPLPSFSPPYHFEIR